MMACALQAHWQSFALRRAERYGTNRSSNGSLVCLRQWGAPAGRFIGRGGLLAGRFTALRRVIVGWRARGQTVEAGASPLVQIIPLCSHWSYTDGNLWEYLFMSAQSYTVREAAALLQLHPKTILRKIREGDIVAAKVGKQYRIAEVALNDFSGGTLFDQGAEPVLTRRQVLASCVVDVDAISPEDSTRITNTVMAVLTSGDNRGARVDCLYYEESGKLKVVIHGPIASTQELLALVQTLVTPQDA